MLSNWCKLIDERMRYIENLNPSEVRFHTYHFEGDNYFPYYQEHNKTFLENQWRSLIKDIPEKYIISEAQPSFGYVIDGRMFNANTISYQRVIKELWKTGALEGLEREKEREFKPPKILEIGSGYGQLAYHLKQIIPQAKFCLIDLPMAIVIAKKYLSYHLRDKIKDVVFYNNNEYKKNEHPQYDLVISDRTFHEMTAEQLEEYVQFIHNHLRGKMYCSSGDGTPFNPAGPNVSNVLAAYFNVETEIAAEQSNMARGNLFNRLLDVSPRKILTRFLKKSNARFVSHHRIYARK